jgi:hypothetical protein
MIPIAPIREELEKIVQSSPLWDGKTQKLQVSNLSEKSVELRIQVSAANADQLSDLQAYVREQILSFIRHHYGAQLTKIYMIEKIDQAHELINLQGAKRS